MKLAVHYSKASIIITLLVLLTGAVIYYFAINYIATAQIDNNLEEELGEVVDYVNQNQKLPKQVDFDEDITKFIKVNSTNIPTLFFDTIYYNQKEKKSEPGRAISGLIKLKTENFKVVIIVSRESTAFLVQIIALITLILSVALLLILFITNRYILSDLWKPFYDTLFRLKSLNVADVDNIELKNCDVDEFNELNEVVSAMSLRVKKDYSYLKHFTENASHEMMTPLAVITSKLDTLIQDETLKPAHFEQINDIYSATNKLSRLNQTLLLLVKIENNLTNDTESLRLDTIVALKLRQFHELISAKDIKVSTNLNPVTIKASKSFIDILLNNLFSNAIRHNYNEGFIDINLSDKQLIFSNSGKINPLKDAHLFERFQKGQNSEGTGLGLTLVKNICSLYNWKISYRFENMKHIFQIDF